MKIISKIDHNVLRRTVQRAKERGVILPTFAQQKNPKLVPAKIQEKLKKIGLQDVNPLNLFRITWKNEPEDRADSAKATGWNSRRRSRAWTPGSSG